MMGVMRMACLALLLFVFCIPASVYAQDNTEATGSLRPANNRIMNVQSTVAVRREEIQARREEIKANVQAKLEEYKMRVVERIQTHLTNRNSRWVSHFDRVLERLGNILARITTRKDKFKAGGVDTASVDAAIQKASDAIQLAQDAVASQEAKTYQITITDASTARQDASEQVTQLRNDVESVRLLVQSARESVHSALMALSTLRISVTPSGMQTQ